MEWDATREAPGTQSSGGLPRYRDLVVTLLLAIFTFGVYTLYWLYVTYRDTHQHLGRAHQAKTALVLAIIGYVLMWFVMALYLVFTLGFAATQREPSVALFSGMIGMFAVLLIASLAVTAVQVWMMWGAARGAELVLQRYGRTPTMPPLVHALVPIVLNLWVYVAIGLVQSDLNKLHPQS